MKLELIDSQLSCATATEEQIFTAAFESIEARGVGRQGKIDADRADGGSITYTKSEGMNHVVEIGSAILSPLEIDSLKVAIHVARVMEEYPTQIVSNQRKAQFQIVHEQSFATNGEPGLQVSWAGLIFWKASM